MARKTRRPARRARPAKRASRKAKPRATKHARPRDIRSRQPKAVATRKPAARPVLKKPPSPPEAKGKIPVGTIRHFYTNISVGVVDLTGDLAVGERISIEGPTTALVQRVESMQINLVAVQRARAGESIGLKVAGRVREGDRVFRA